MNQIPEPFLEIVKDVTIRDLLIRWIVASKIYYAHKDRSELFELAESETRLQIQVSPDFEKLILDFLNENKLFNTEEILEDIEYLAEFFYEFLESDYLKNPSNSVLLERIKQLISKQNDYSKT